MMNEINLKKCLKNVKFILVKKPQNNHSIFPVIILSKID